MTRTLLFISNALAAILTALALLPGGHSWLALVVILCFCFWIYGYSRRWGWAATLNLFIAFGILAIAFLLNPGSALLYPAVFLSLAGWDLAGLDARLRLAGGEEDQSRIQTRHLLRLGATLAVGAALVWVALTFQLKPIFEWIAILAVLAAWGLGRLVHRLLKNG